MLCVNSEKELRARVTISLDGRNAFAIATSKHRSPLIKESDKLSLILSSVMEEKELSHYSKFYFDPVSGFEYATPVSEIYYLHTHSTIKLENTL